MAASLDASTRVQPLRRNEGSTTRDLLLAIPFLVLLYVQLAHHVMWRDELNGLAIEWASPTIRSLFWHIHHEGHPWLWYMILWVPSRFTQSVLVPKFVQGIVSTAIILLVALRSPFRTAEKALVLSGYFFVFEYTVLARMYGVMLLLMVLYLWQRTRRPDKPVGAAVLLGLMASTDTLGIILSVALIGEYAYSAWVQRNQQPLFSRAFAIRAVAVYAVIAGFAVWSAKPAKDISWRTTGRPLQYATSITHLYDAFLRYTILPFIPVESPRSHFFWNPNLHLSRATYTVMMLVILGMVYVGFRRRKSLFVLMAIAIAGGTALEHFVYPGSERHFGLVFLAFVAGVWILRAAEPAVPLAWTIYVLLGVSALSSVWAVVGSWKHPFSNDKRAAEWMVANHLDRMPFVAEQDTSAIGVAEYLHRPVYMIECSCADTYLLFSSRRDDFTDADAPERILQAEHVYHDQPLLFMRIRPITPYEEGGLEQEGFTIQPLASFTGAEEINENFYFYRLALKSADRGDQSAGQASAR